MSYFWDHIADWGFLHECAQELLRNIKWSRIL